MNRGHDRNKKSMYRPPEDPCPIVTDILFNIIGETCDGSNSPGVKIAEIVPRYVPVEQRPLQGSSGAAIRSQRSATPYLPTSTRFESTSPLVTITESDLREGMLNGCELKWGMEGDMDRNMDRKLRYDEHNQPSTFESCSTTGVTSFGNTPYRYPIIDMLCDSNGRVPLYTYDAPVSIDEQLSESLLVMNDKIRHPEPLSLGGMRMYFDAHTSMDESCSSNNCNMTLLNTSAKVECMDTDPDWLEKMIEDANTRDNVRYRNNRHHSGDTRPSDSIAAVHSVPSVATVPSVAMIPVATSLSSAAPRSTVIKLSPPSILPTTANDTAVEHDSRNDWMSLSTVLGSLTDFNLPNIGSDPDQFSYTDVLIPTRPSDQLHVLRPAVEREEPVYENEVRVDTPIRSILKPPRSSHYDLADEIELLEESTAMIDLNLIFGGVGLKNGCPQ